MSTDIEPPPPIVDTGAEVTHLIAVATGAPVERDLQRDLRAVIEYAILQHPRGLQAQIGPSEIGTECLRKLGHKLAWTPRARAEAPAWRPTVGTAVHTWAAGTFERENEILGRVRWLIESTVDVGDIGGNAIFGSSDLYDIDTQTVIDWKFPGISTVRRVKQTGDPGRQYRAQAHLYGRGFVRRGIPVSTVAIYYLPAAGELGDGYFWSEPYDEQVALDALWRADSLTQGIAAAGADVFLPLLPTSPDHCAYCPFWSPGATDLAKVCPGDPSAIKAAPTGPAFGRVV